MTVTAVLLCTVCFATDEESDDGNTYQVSKISYTYEGKEYYFVATTNTTVALCKEDSTIIAGNVSDNTATTYTGDLVIPDTIVYRDSTFYVTSIAVYCFYQGTEITSVKLPSRLLKINAHAFDGCTALTSVGDIPDAVSEIGDYAFRNCSSLDSINIPDSLKTLGSFAFYGCSSIDSKIVLPDSMTTVGKYTFYDCNAIPEIELSENITTLGEYAFAKCRAMKTINIHDKITEMGAYCFYGCWSLEGTIKLPTNSTFYSVPSYCFGHCHSVEAFEIGSNVKYLNWASFLGCSKITKLELPASIVAKGLGSNVFQQDSSLVEVVFADGSKITRIPPHAFDYCMSLTDINIPSTVTEIDSCAFRNDSSLVSITLPEGLDTLGGYAFANCVKLESISIPDGVEFVPQFCFYHCSSLKDVTLGSGITSINPSCFHSTAVEHIDFLPEAVTKLANRAFCSCPNLTFVKMPSHIATIGDYCFYSCSQLDTVKIYNPEVITLEQSNGTSYAFAGNKSTRKFFVLPYSLYAYQNGDYWKDTNNYSYWKFIYPFHDYTVTEAECATLCLPFSSNLPEGLTVYRLDAITIDLDTLHGTEITRSTWEDITSSEYWLTNGKHKPVYVTAAAGEYYFYGTQNGAENATVYTDITQTIADSVVVEISNHCQTDWMEGNFMADSAYYAPLNSFVLQKQGSTEPAFYRVAKENSIPISQFRGYVWVSEDYVDELEEKFSSRTKYAPVSTEGLKIKLESADDADDEITAIAAVYDADEHTAAAADGPVYNLQGVRMNPDCLPKGIYIKNGRKFIVQ